MILGFWKEIEQRWQYGKCEEQSCGDYAREMVAGRWSRTPVVAFHFIIPDVYGRHVEPYSMLQQWHQFGHTRMPAETE